MKAKHIPFTLALILAVFPAACRNPVVNINTPQVAENQSRIYSLFVNARLNENNMIEGTTKAFVVIEGETYPMTLAAYGDEIYQYDYHMPVDHMQAKYYFVIKYDEKFGLLVKHREWKSDQTYTLNIVNHYVQQMEVTRGLVGSVVPIVGRGFMPEDYIVIGGIAAPTRVPSAIGMTFQVPPLAPGDYPVEWHSGSEVIQVGAFHVDISNFKVAPDSLEVASTNSTTLTISMDQLAPDGGLPVSVMTNVPASVIMDKVVIPAGQNSVNVKITGGQPGAGNLLINTPGFNPVTVSIKVDDAPPPPVIPVTTTPVVVPPVDTSTPILAPVAPVTPPSTPAEPAQVIRGS